jgi:two-component system, LytTR family, response regulator
MRCIIIDDEPKAIEIITRYVESLPDLILIGSYREPLKALHLLQAGDVDLVFLDINMPGISGIQLAKSLRTNLMVIFTTAHSEHALESYDVQAVDYLVKPILFDRFIRAIGKAREIFKTKTGEKIINESDVRIFKSGHLAFRVKLDELLFLEKDGNYFNVFTKTRKFLIRDNMKDILDRLPAEQFIRVHKSYIVSRRHIEVIDSHQLQIGNHKIPIGAMYREEALKALYQ